MAHPVDEYREVTLDRARQGDGPSVIAYALIMLADQQARVAKALDHMGAIDESLDRVASALDGVAEQIAVAVDFDPIVEVIEKLAKP